jgi:hypothetical protein
MKTRSIVQNRLTRYDGIAKHIQTMRNKYVKIYELYARVNMIKETGRVNGTPIYMARYFLLLTKGYKTSPSRPPMSDIRREDELKRIFSLYGMEIATFHEGLISVIEKHYGITPPPSAVSTGHNIVVFRDYWKDKKRKNTAKARERLAAIRLENKERRAVIEKLKKEQQS